MTALVGISCDGCGNEVIRKTYRQMSATDVRDIAKERGWHKTRGKYTSGGSYARDICKSCWTEGKR